MTRLEYWSDTRSVTRLLTYADICHASFVLSEQLTRERGGGGSYALTYADVEAVCSDLSLKLRFRAEVATEVKA